MISLKQRIEQDNVQAESVMTDRPADARGDPSDGANWYRVTLRRKGGRMTVNFGMGAALTEEPTAHDVMQSLLSDASGIENARDFEDWADEYGYDTDSRAAEKSYQATVAEVAKLRKFLGDDFSAYVWETEAE
jgi:hypothetical protein